MPLCKSYLIGLLPPPPTGQSVAFAALCDGFKHHGLPHIVIDISDREVRADGHVSLRRLASLVRPLLSGLRLILPPRANVYLINAQSWPGFLRDLVFITCARLGRHRLVLHLHGGSYDAFYAKQPALRQRIIRNALASANQLIVLGSALKETYDFVAGYRGKVVIVPNGLPEKLPKWEEVVRAKTGGGDELRILYLSNLMETKGYLDVLEAVRILVHDHGLNVKADFCGDFWLTSDRHLYRSVDEAKADFMRRIHLYGLGDRLTWHGSVSGNRKRELLAGAHYFALPTYYKYEGQPISIIEAMAYGALVISTRYRTIPEMLDEGRAGVFVEPKSPGRIVDVILSRPFGSPRYNEVVAAARRRCEGVFTREQHLDRLIAVITGSDFEH